MKKVFIPVFLLCLSCAAFAQKTETYIPTAEAFFELMDLGKFHDAYLMLDSSVTKIVSEEQNTAGWKKIRAKLGAFKRQIRSRTEEMKPYTGVYLTCEFDSAVLDFKVVFREQSGIVGYFFVPMSRYKNPPYADTTSMIERQVLVKTGTFILSGILTLPKKGDHFPVVVLVHGSGPEDKDETIGMNKPFKDIAFGLAAKGIATIRYDKRTFVYGLKSAPDPKAITLKEETIDDAVSALRLAQSVTEIDPKKIFILGHSQGGMSAPRIAKQAPFVAGIISMAGNARSFEDVILDQMSYIIPLQAPRNQVDSILEVVTAQVARVRRGDFNDSTAKLPLGLSAVYWKDMKNYDQVATAKSLPIPMLFLQGEKDYQVTMKDLTMWKQGLASKKNVTYISYPGLFHLFMPGEGKPSDYQNPGHVSEKVISDIAAWIKK